jgi:hypothetical protein
MTSAAANNFWALTVNKSGSPGPAPTMYTPGIRDSISVKLIATKNFLNLLTLPDAPVLVGSKGW